MHGSIEYIVHRSRSTIRRTPPPPARASLPCSSPAPQPTLRTSQRYYAVPRVRQLALLSSEVFGRRLSTPPPSRNKTETTAETQKQKKKQQNQKKKKTQKNQKKKRSVRTLRVLQIWARNRCVLSSSRSAETSSARKLQVCASTRASTPAGTA